MVLPRFIIHMSKHLQALTSHYKVKCSEETTASLREAMLSEIKLTMQQSTTTQDRLTEDVGDLRALIDGLQQQISDLKDERKQEHFLAKEKTKTNLAKYLIEDEIEQSKVKREANRFLQIQFKNEELIAEELQKPRQLSIKQLSDLFYTFLHTSHFKDTQQAFRVTYDSFSESVRNYHTENDGLWKTQLDENAQHKFLVQQLRSSVDQRFEEQKKTNLSFGEGLTNGQN
ncbi:hypothetical protein FGO68_gene17646 [Halteria grandinella]|uniref:Uncharacterized protein n=1 Tax=Halteria grandinella TaxID=5974 RepID=A0A8J8NF22_HALGN|nr:hypothetical protein FGO68_gene17646 [Halteria grandinella]